jgi:hypothetical protein
MATTHMHPEALAWLEQLRQRLVAQVAEDKAKLEVPAASTLVAPIFSDGPHYREWEIARDGIGYLIINEDGEDGDWPLYRWCYVAEEWQEIGVGVDIDAFLKQHNLRLGE